MSPRRKTTGILALAGGVVVAALLFTHASSRARAVPFGGGSGSGGGMSVAARMESTHVLFGDHETHLALTITAPTIDASVRPPLHLAIVLDRSHSMNEDDGMRIVHARQAAVQLVSALGAHDRFSVIAYHHEAIVLYPDSAADERAKREAITAIEGLQAAGTTNIGGGLQAGVDELEHAPAMPGAVARIVLVSDGEPTEGLLRSELPPLAARIAEHGISITAVGVGLDFDEQTMTRISSAGRGNYYFVEAADRLAAMFADELGRLGRTAATDVRVALTPAPGVTVLDAYGYPLQSDGGAVIIPVADMHSGEQRKIVLRIRVNAGELGAMDIGRIETSFLQVASGEHARATLTARAMVTRDDRLVLRYRDREAVRHVERALTARAIDEATELYQQGQMEQAQHVLQIRAETVSGIAADMGYADLDKEIGSSIGRAGGNFAAAPAAPASDPGKKAQKDNRADANDMYLK